MGNGLRGTHGCLLPPCPLTVEPMMRAGPPGVAIGRCDAASSKDVSIVCDSRADVVLVVDRSFSIGHNFKYIKRFVTALVSALDVSPSTTRVGLVSYADTRTIEFDLLRYNNTAAMLKHVDTMTNRYNGGLTRTMDGLKDARESVLVQRRPGVPAFVILLTDGESNDGTGTAAQATERTIAQAGLIKELPDVTIICIGVGPHINMKELAAVATEGEDNVYKVNNFQHLDKELVMALLRQRCEEQVVDPCEVDRRYADVMFVAGSQHLNPKNGQLALKMAEAFLRNRLVAATDHIRVGVAPSRCQLDIGYPLDTSRDAVGRMTNDKLKYSFLSTHNYLSDLDGSFVPRNDGNPVDVKIAVLPLDHRLPVTLYKDAVDSAAAARRKSVLLVVVGVGNQFDEKQAKNLASPDLFLRTDDYGNLLPVASNGTALLNDTLVTPVFETVLTRICEAPKVPRG